MFARREFFLIRCKYSQQAANQFLRWLEKRLYSLEICRRGQSAMDWNQAASYKSRCTRA